MTALANGTLRVHSFVPWSRANGPGPRAVLWLQGCSLGCPGCFNPETHSLSEGEIVPDAVMLDRIRGARGIEGLTVSGGEPLQQARPLFALLRELRRTTDLSVLVFSGYRWGEIERMPFVSELTTLIDVLIAGRYLASERLARGLRGSTNKTVHFFSDRYAERDLEEVPDAELIIQPDGVVLSTGIDPLRWGG